MALQVSTERTYYQNTNLFQLQSTVVDSGKDETGIYAVFDKTIFHPQGGGQPDDKGTLQIGEDIFNVTKLSAPRDPNEVPYVIKHYYEPNKPGETPTPLKIDSIVIQTIDKEVRMRHARYHSAGHLLSNAVNQLYPSIDGCRGNHVPGQANVVFNNVFPTGISSEQFKSEVQQLTNQYINSHLPLKNSWESNPRTIQFGDLKAYPCGGTHVDNTQEIGNVVIRNVKKEKQGFRIGYDIS